MQTFGDRLKEARQKRGLSTKQLAETCGITAGGLAHHEAGRRDYPNAETLGKLAAALDVSIDWLVTGETSDRGAPASMPPTANDSGTLPDSTAAATGTHD